MKANINLYIIFTVVNKKRKTKTLKVILFLILYCGSTAALAQHNVFSVGSSKLLTIKGSTVFSADSLVLIPGSDFTMSSNAILETPVPTPGYPTGSIDRVYYLNSPISFTGTILIYYQVSELNGNNESSLQYTDSTIASWWQISSSSIINTTSHFVSQALSGHSIIAATAAQAGTVLALKLVSFTGTWNEDHVGLQWIIDQNEESKSFTVESSPDEQYWQVVAIVPGSQVAGRYQYFFNDGDAAFTTRLYRIKITDESGAISYSPIVKISKGATLNNLFIVGKSNGATVYFTGMQPKTVRVMNAAGQVVWRNNTSSNQYELNNLLPGVYFLQYEMNGQTGVKKFALR
jgi:hypothetical protein